MKKNKYSSAKADLNKVKRGLFSSYIQRGWEWTVSVLPRWQWQNGREGACVRECERERVRHTSQSGSSYLLSLCLRKKLAWKKILTKVNSTTGSRKQKKKNTCNKVIEIKKEQSQMNGATHLWSVLSTCSVALWLLRRRPPIHESTHLLYNIYTHRQTLLNTHYYWLTHTLWRVTHTGGIKGLF